MTKNGQESARRWSRFPKWIIAGALALTTPHVASQPLIGLTNNGALFRVNKTSGTTTLIGSTGIRGVAGLEIAPDGSLYALSSGNPGTNTPTLYRIDTRTAAATVITTLSLGHPTFEGALAFAPNGTVYAATQSGLTTGPLLFTIDIDTGATEILGIVEERADINGLAWRDDGVLVAVDRITNSLMTINLETGRGTVVAQLTTELGTTSGLAVIEGQAYLATAYASPATNSLFEIDLYTGAVERIGPLTQNMAASFSGLSAGPCHGDFSSYGNGLAGSGNVIPTLLGNGCPTPAEPVTLEIQNGLGAAQGALLIGLAPESTPVLGGTRLVTPLAVIPHQLHGNGPGDGSLTLPLSIPDASPLIGVDHYFQSFYLDSGAAQGVSHTDGLKMTIG